MKKTFVLSIAVSVILVTASAWGGDKEKDDDTLKNSAKVLQEMLASKSVPSSLLAKANCVMVLPAVKKVGFGIGGGGGRGPMTCRTGKDFKGKWSAPAMFSIGGISAGLQVGVSSRDFLLLIMTEKGMDTILKGKTKLGNDASVAAGPSGATTAHPITADVVTYGRAKGIFAGTSISGASLEADNDANKRLYGREISARDVVLGNAVTATAGGEQLIAVLNSNVAKQSKAASKK